MELFLNKDLVTGYTLTPDGVLAYIALRRIMDESITLINKTTTVDCVSVNKMAYTLIGSRECYEKALTDALQRGIYELVGGNSLAIVKDFSSKNSYEYLLDFTNMYLDKEKDNFIIITSDEVYKILVCNEVMKKKISMLKYFVALISTFNWSKSMSCLENMPNLQGKIGAMSMEYIATQADNSQRTCIRYNDILVDMKMIYVYKSNDKIREGDKLKQIKNCYSRYEDKDLCKMYASNYENIVGHNHKIVRTQKKKEQADNNRRLAQIYNRICEGYGDSYDEATIRDVYKYITNKNKSLQSDINDKYDQPYYKEKGQLSYSDQAWVEKLESQIRDTLIFEQFEFLKSDQKVSEGTGDWGEPDPMENDIPVEDNEQFQSDLAKETASDLHSEGVNPKMDSHQGSQKSSKVDRDDLELIDIESLFDEDTDDRPVLSQEEAWELFA